MKTKLINAIKETVIDLETNRKGYEHSDPEICNCGLLAQNLGVHSDSICGFGFFQDEVRSCKTTGTNLKSVFQKLFNAGLTEDDIINLENLSDDKILHEVGKELIRYVREDVILYFRAWLRILEREQDKVKVNYSVTLSVTSSDITEHLTTKKLQLS